MPYPALPRTYNFITLSAAVGPNAEQALARIKRIIWDIDARRADLSAISMREQVGDAIARPRFVSS